MNERENKSKKKKKKDTQEMIMLERPSTQPASQPFRKNKLVVTQHSISSTDQKKRIWRAAAAAAATATGWLYVCVCV
jgi:hypothetical protein